MSFGEADFADIDMELEQIEAAEQRDGRPILVGVVPLEQGAEQPPLPAAQIRQRGNSNPRPVPDEQQEDLQQNQPQRAVDRPPPGQQIDQSHAVRRAQRQPAVRMGQQPAAPAAEFLRGEQQADRWVRQAPALPDRQGRRAIYQQRRAQRERSHYNAQARVVDLLYRISNPFRGRQRGRGPEQY